VVRSEQRGAADSRRTWAWRAGNGLANYKRARSGPGDAGCTSSAPTPATDPAAGWTRPGAACTDAAALDDQLHITLRPRAAVQHDDVLGDLIGGRQVMGDVDQRRCRSRGSTPQRLEDGRASEASTIETGSSR